MAAKMRAVANKQKEKIAAQKEEIATLRQQVGESYQWQQTNQLRPHTAHTALYAERLRSMQGG